MKCKNRVFLMFSLILIFIVIPIIYTATENKTYEIFFAGKEGIKVGEEFNIKIKLVEDQKDSEASESDKLYLKIEKKENVILEEKVLEDNKTNYIYDRTKGVLEIDKQKVGNEIDIPLKATVSGNISLELYEENKELDNISIEIQEKESLGIGNSKLSTKVSRILNKSIYSADVYNGTDFDSAMKNPAITEINIQQDFALEQYTSVVFSYLNSSRRPVGTEIVINGNGHTVDFRGVSYNFNATSLSNYNSVIFNNIGLQGRNWYGPIMMDGASNTGATITYDNVKYEGSQMTSAWISKIIVKGLVDSSSVNSYVSKIDSKVYSTAPSGSDQQNLDVSDIVFSKDSEYIGKANTMPISLGHNSTGGGTAILEENAKVTLQRYGNSGETLVGMDVTLYMRGSLTLGKNSTLNTISGTDTAPSTAGGIRIANSGSKITVGEGAKLSAKTIGSVRGGSNYAGISIDNNASLDIKPTGKVQVTQEQVGTATTRGIYMGSGSIVNIGENGEMDVLTEGSGTGITTGGSSNFNVGRGAKLNVKLDNGTLIGRNGITTGTGSSFIVEENGILNVEVSGAGTGINVGSSSTFDISGHGNMNLNLQNTGIYTTSALNSAAGSKILVKKDGIVDIKSDGTASKNLINIAYNTSSEFRFSDAKRINLEFTEKPNTGSKLINMPSGFLSVDIQSAKVWDKDTLLVDENFPIKLWTPIWTPDGVKTVSYNLYGDTNKVLASSMSETLANDFNSNFRTENYRKILFEGIADVSVTINPLSNNQTSPNSYTITGKTNPGAHLRFSGDSVIPQGDITSPLDSEKADPNKNYHVIADSNGDYSYSLPNGSYFTENNVVESYSYLNGKSATATTIVNHLIYIPDPNLRKAINKKLTGTATTTPMYFTVPEIESLTELVYSGQGLADSNKIVDLTGLEYAINLTNIDFGYNKISDLTPISKLEKLESLNLRNNYLHEIFDMSKMTELKYLNLIGNYISDVNGLSGALNLKELNLDSNWLTDISPLSSLSNLNLFSARQNQIQDITVVKNFLGLKNLNLGFNKISDVSPVANLNNLELLDFTKNQISNIRPLESLININKLYLGQNMISDISSLDNLTKLNVLNLYLNNVQDITSLKDKLDLSNIVLSSNKIKDVTPLRNLVNLKSLSISNNQIIDISSLDLIINNITTFSAGGQTFNLGTVKINGNKLTLDNPTKTIEGSVEVTTVDSGVYDLSTNKIQWENLGSTESRSFDFKDNKRDFGGKISLGIKRVGIMNPNSPNSLNTSPKPEGIADINHELKLAMNYIEPIEFGTNSIESRNMNIKAITKTPYVQLSDLRDVSTGWKLSVRGSSLKEDKIGGLNIEGARIRFKNGEIKSSPTGNIDSPTISNDTIVSLDSLSSSVQVMKADSGKGKGTWLGVWNGTGTTNEKVVMEVPGNKVRVGTYKTVLNWELTDTP